MQYPARINIVTLRNYLEPPIRELAELRTLGDTSDISTERYFCQEDGGSARPETKGIFWELSVSAGAEIA